MNCKITFVRELTKKNDEVINAPISTLINILEQRTKIQGEITFIIESLINDESISKKDILKIAAKLSKQGLSMSDISKTIAEDYKISKRQIYQLLINK